MELSGEWRGAASSPELERDGADPDLDDTNWDLIPVPGHWGQIAPLADSDGPVVYRHRFSFPTQAEDTMNRRDGGRHWLRFDGVLSNAEVWLDGHHLGDIGTYFAQHRFEVGELLTPRPAVDDGHNDHLLAVEVACPRPGSGAKRTLTGALQSGPLAPPGSPGGIWGQVNIDETGPIAIMQARLLCVEATPEQATLQFRVELDAAEAGPARIDTSVVGPDGSTAGGAAGHDLASGENHLEWTTTVDSPQLWWPAALGDQPCYDVSIAVRTTSEESGPTPTVSDRRHWRTGIRSASVDGLQWEVNGERLFIKGIAVGPHSRFLATIDPDQLRRDVTSVRDAGLDLIRVYGHITRPELYRAADELGILIWQDLPLVGTYSTRARPGARHLARLAIDELGHHPSIVAWCGHDEPNGPPLPPPETNKGLIKGRQLSRHMLPSWSRSVLDPIIRRELRAADPSRSVITRSGSLPNLIDFTESDSHLWLGWRAGRAEDLAELIRRWPRLGTFIGAIGSQSIADDTTESADWAGAEQGSFARYLPQGAYPDQIRWADATRRYQADLIRTQVETARRLKYRPTGGFCVISLFDSDPAGGFGILDAARRAKPALNALVDACRPIVVVGDIPPPIVTPGQELALAIHAISDLRSDLGPLTVSARARLGQWQVERRWEGQLPADSCSYVGTLRFDVPDLTGALVIDLELEAADELATNRYQTVIIPPSEAITARSTQRSGR
ncbi:MAG: hypothetical protein GY724_24655 [Actinomycetia bacterium]|nr:hypothetical protein [Actinomycetes bacterium]MCP5035642.1 hypothetical protein [Actinomycetes bacterium]